MLQFNNAKNECINVNTKEEIILKKLVSLLEAILLMVMAFPLTALAGQEGTQIISPVFCIPFAGLLLCVAIMPLVKAEWWESHQPHAVVFWSVLFVIPFAIFFGAGEATEKVLECIIDDYLTFIVLLFGLFCVAGNITLEGDLAGSPRINVGLLLLGTMLSSWVGTTGASMLMVRPVIKMNAWRKRRSHIMVFFIFLISNIGGCLTPIGDPPLLMGFMRGVPFFWSLHLLPILLFNVVVLLTVFPGPQGLQKGHCRRKKTRHQQTRYRGTYPGTSQSDLSGYDRCCRYLKRNFTGNGSI